MAAADLCRYARRSADEPKKMRMRWVSSGSSPANRNVQPRLEQLQVGRKPQNVSGYGLAQLTRQRRHLRHPLRRDQDQAPRTGTRVREGIIVRCMRIVAHSLASNVFVCTSRAFSLFKVDCPRTFVSTCILVFCSIQRDLASHPANVK